MVKASLAVLVLFGGCSLSGCAWLTKNTICRITWCHR